MGKGFNLDLTLEEHIKKQKHHPGGKSGGSGKNSGKRSGGRKNFNNGNNKNFNGNGNHNGKRSGNRKPIQGYNKNQGGYKNQNNNQNNQNQGGYNKKRSMKRSNSRNPGITKNIKKNKNQKSMRSTRGLKRTGSQGRSGSIKRIIRRSGQSPVSQFSAKNMKRLIVSNLPLTVSNNEINELFSPYGPMNVCKIKYDKLGKSYGVAVVEYRNETYAKKAMKDYNGAELDTEILSISYAKKKGNNSNSNSNYEAPQQRNRIIDRVIKRSNDSIRNRKVKFNNKKRRGNKRNNN